MNNYPIYIFDLDGTIALNDHRLHHIQKNPPDWDAFFLDCEDDQPNWPVIRTMQMLATAREPVAIFIFSGRSDIAAGPTERWLERFNVPYDYLTMRRQGDYTPDYELKRKILNDLAPGAREQIVGVFDDRDKVVAMWREEGIACFQVAPGDF